MADDQCADLLHGYVTGTLSDAEGRELAAAIDGDPTLNEQLLEQLLVHRLLRQRQRSPVSADRVLAALSDLPAVTDRVMERVQRTRVESSRLNRARRAPPARWSRPLAWAAAAGLVAMVPAAGEALRRGRAHPGEQTLATLTVRAPATAVIARPGSAGIVVHDRAELRAGDAVSAPSSASADIAYADGTTIELQADGELTFERPIGGKLLTLTRGSLRATVSPQPAGNPMRITSDDVRVVIIGTRFTFSALAGSFPRLDVEHGRLRFERLSDHASVEVADGQSVLAQPGRPLLAATGRTAVADAYGVERDPSALHGEEKTLRVADGADPHGVCVACLQFQLGTTRIERAVLHLTATAGSGRFDIYRSSDDTWSDRAVNFYHIPERDPAPIGSAAVDREGAVDIQLDAAAIGRGNVSLVLVPRDGCNLAFASHESGAAGPRLDLSVAP